MNRTKLWLALTLSFAMVAAACGSSGSDDAAADAGDSGSEDAGDGGGGSDWVLDIDAVLAADLDNCEPAPTGEALKIGYAADKTEVSGFADIPGSEAAGHVVDLINCIGGVDGHPVEYQVQDVQGDPDVALRATQDLLDFGAHALIGPPFADMGNPIIQVTDAQVPVFFMASTEPSLPSAADRSFLVSFDDTAQATAAAEWALENGFTRAITFSSPGPYFGYNPEIFTEVFEAGGGEVVLDQVYAPIEDTDFSTQVNEVAAVADGTEIIYSAMLSFQMGALRAQLEGQGIELDYFGTDAFDGTGGLGIENNEGIYHTNHVLDAPGSRVEALAQSIEAATGTRPESPTWPALAADSVFLIVQAWVDSGEQFDGVAIGEAVTNISGFNGLTGEMGYAGTDGVPKKPVSIQQVQDGANVLIEAWG